ncbi:uncharacterized protein LOC129211221 [Grus americana]|uniref:uncharacterized protein LOC129211221 n=1 Tax=Grus americana TaxID=9117 RepID=UPI0024078E4C|nr:uncharacterized protein LOC129211221 [Grus americana]XP_054693916.1 uncharacterized protein LOC129211221 [Grus americana]
MGQGENGTSRFLKAKMGGGCDRCILARHPKGFALLHVACCSLACVSTCFYASIIAPALKGTIPSCQQGASQEWATKGEPQLHRAWMWSWRKAALQAANIFGLRRELLLGWRRRCSHQLHRRTRGCLPLGGPQKQSAGLKHFLASAAPKPLPRQLPPPTSQPPLAPGLGFPTFPPCSPAQWLGWSPGLASVPAATPGNAHAGSSPCHSHANVTPRTKPNSPTLSHLHLCHQRCR